MGNKNRDGLGQPKPRNRPCTCFPITINIGMLLAQILGLLYMDSSSYSWQIILLGMLIPLCILLICSFYLGGTPRSMIMKGKLERRLEELMILNRSIIRFF